jgi:hypothetical protein
MNRRQGGWVVAVKRRRREWANPRKIGCIRIVDTNKRCVMAMKIDYLLTDGEWEKLQKSDFQAQDVLKDLALWDSIRHIAGNSDFSAEVCRNVQKIRELIEHVFIDGGRDSVEELFFESSCMEDLMRDMEDWIVHVRRALAFLNGLRPESLSISDSDTEKSK